MGQLTKIPKLTTRRDPVCVYFWRGKFFMRSSSSLTGSRVKEDPAFAKTMRNAGLLAKASKLASQVYKAMPAGKQHWQYQKLTSRAMELLKHDLKDEEILSYLLELFRDYNFKKR